ncbi:MAG: hypothetical protein II969_15495 [Anaerolineaceae bacterium]|nr:hypothetical protein [Anaerolineaceae bacterium]
MKAYFEEYFTYTLLECFGLSYDPERTKEREQYWKNIWIQSIMVIMGTDSRIGGIFDGFPDYHFPRNFCAAMTALFCPLFFMQRANPGRGKDEMFLSHDMI